MKGRVHFLEVDDGEGVVEEAHLQIPIGGSVGSHGGTAVDFDEPGLESAIEHDVEAIEFEASLIIGDSLAGGY